MLVENQIATCGEHYKMWKEKALFSNDIYQSKRAIERAFFWLELRSAFIFLNVIEQTKGNDRETKQKLIQAKVNLSKKLSEYAKELLDELERKNYGC